MNFNTTRGFCLALALLIAHQPSFGQLTEARMKGTVTDSSAQPVSGVTVTATNDSTGEQRTSLTDTRGTYVLSELSPGRYKVSVAVKGFNSFEQQGIQLSVGQTSEVDVQLQLGTISEQVSVQASVDQVQVSTDGRLSDSYGTKQIADLPIPQRDVFAITKLSAGATAIPGAANSTKLINSPVITVNGNRYRGNDYVLDGSMNTNPNNTGEPAIVPNLESVEEAQVQTDNFSSEFGRGNGAVINLAQNRELTNSTDDSGSTCVIET